MHGHGIVPEVGDFGATAKSGFIIGKYHALRPLANLPHSPPSVRANGVPSVQIPPEKKSGRARIKSGHDEAARMKSASLAEHGSRCIPAISFTIRPHPARGRLRGAPDTDIIP